MWYLDQFRKHWSCSKDIDKAKLRENFAVFLKAIIPGREALACVWRFTWTIRRAQLGRAKALFHH